MARNTSTTPAAADIEDVTPEVTEDEAYDFAADDAIEADASMATTDSFFNDAPTTVNEIVDLGVIEVDEASPTVIVRPITDIGPIFYGKREVAMKKGRQYRVPQDIARYVRERNLDWNQQDQTV